MVYWFWKINTFPDSIPVEGNTKYSLEQLKTSNDSTQFLADPFFIKVKDTFYLFFEHKKTKKDHAEIGLLTSIDGKKYTYQGTVLKEKFHLSYPQVFEYKKNYYMIPESQGSNQVLLYKARRFPYDWKVCDTLLKDIKLKDQRLFIRHFEYFISYRRQVNNVYVPSRFSLWEMEVTQETKSNYGKRIALWWSDFC